MTVKAQAWTPGLTTRLRGLLCPGAPSWALEGWHPTTSSPGPPPPQNPVPTPPPTLGPRGHPRSCRPQPFCLPLAQRGGQPSGLHRICGHSPSGLGPSSVPGRDGSCYPTCRSAAGEHLGSTSRGQCPDTTSCPARAGFLQEEAPHSSIIQVGKPRHRARMLPARSFSWTAPHGGHQPVPKLRTGPLAVPRAQELPSQGRDTWLEPDPYLPHGWAPGDRPKLSQT